MHAAAAAHMPSCLWQVAAALLALVACGMLERLYNATKGCINQGQKQEQSSNATLLWSCIEVPSTASYWSASRHFHGFPPICMAARQCELYWFMRLNSCHSCVRQAAMWPVWRKSGNGPADFARMWQQ